MSRASTVTGKLVLATTKRTLVGRTIVDFAQRPFADGRGGYARDPVIRLDDGTELTFQVQETDANQYGVRIHRRATRKDSE